MLKNGDKVKYNGLFGPMPNYDDRVFEVASEPWQCGENQLVKLKGERGAVRVDCLEKDKIIYDEHIIQAFVTVKNYCIKTECARCILGMRDYSCYGFCPLDWKFREV